MSTNQDQLDRLSLNAALVRKAAKDQWYRDHPWWKTHILIAVKGFMPYLIIFVAVGLLAQSAPHTMAAFEALTPGFGWLAPFIVEGALIYLEFMRQQNILNNTPFGRINWAMQVMMFSVSIIVNAVGAFDAVVNATASLHGQSLAQVMAGWSGLDGRVQMLLALVVLEAIVIPTGTVMAGAGFAKLAHWHETKTSERDRQWQRDRLNVLYTAFMDALVRSGADPKLQRTQRNAMALAQELPTDKIADSGGIVAKPEMSDASGSQPARQALPKGEAARRLAALRAADPQFYDYPLSKIAELTGAGKSAISEYRLAHPRPATSPANAAPISEPPHVPMIEQRPGLTHTNGKSDIDFAIDHFRNNPSDLIKPGIILADTVLHNGKSLSASQWNAARKEVNQ